MPLCATCHVHIEGDWSERLPPSTPMETEMLNSVASERRATSRLGCQIQVTGDMDGMRVTIPETLS